MICYREALKEKVPLPLQKFADAVDYLIRYQLWNEARQFVMEIKQVASYEAQIKDETKEAHQFERAEAMIEIELGDPEVGASRLESLLKTLEARPFVE